MDIIREWLAEYLGLSNAFQYKLLVSGLIILGIFLLRKALIFFLHKNISDIKKKYNWKKGVAYFSYFLLLVIISPIWVAELHSLGTFLGLLSAGLAIALKDPISNLFAWVYIILKKPFEMGNRIQIEDFEGDILDIGFFEFTMLEIKNWVKADQSTGRIIHIPNGKLFTKGVVNYNQALNHIWNEIPVVITFESDWVKAKKILLEIEAKHLKALVKHSKHELENAAQKYNVIYSNLDPAVYTTIQDNGVKLTLRYLCDPRKRRESEQLGIEAMLTAFRENGDIHFAYPTTRFYNAKIEGKQFWSSADI